MINYLSDHPLNHNMMKKITISIFVISLIAVILYFTASSNHPTAFACNTAKHKQTGLGLKGIESGYPEFKTTSDCGELVQHKSISLMYCEKYEEPIWVSYILTKAEITSDNKLERFNKFREDPLVKTGSAVTSDYTKSDYDRGHLAPNADMNRDQTSMEECFYLSNISPQAPSFNRGIWKKLEETVRKWAVKYDSLYIVTGPDLSDVSDYIGKKNKIGVPKHFYKVILDAKGPVYSGIAFYFPNEGSDKAIYDYALSIRELEKKLGCNFFAKLNPQIMDEVETKLNVKEWKESNE